MTKKKDGPNVIGYAKHLEVIGLLNKEIKDLREENEHWREDAEKYRTEKGQLLEEAQTISASYANLKRESEMKFAQFEKQIELMQASKDALHKDYLRAQAEASNLKGTWYHKLFNRKSK